MGLLSEDRGGEGLMLGRSIGDNIELSPRSPFIVHPSAVRAEGAKWIGELAKTRKVIAVEMQGHGRTADIKRDFTYEDLSDDVAGLFDYLKIAGRGHHGLQPGRRRRDRVCDPPSGKSA